MLIGLSVSQCIHDLASGLVDMRYVAYIIGGTKHETEADFIEACLRYAQGAWHGVELDAMTIAANLWSQGRIMQPRLSDGPLLNTGEGNWLKCEQISVHTGKVWQATAPNWYDGFPPHRKYED